MSKNRPGDNHAAIALVVVLAAVLGFVAGRSSVVKEKARQAPVRKKPAISVQKKKTVLPEITKSFRNPKIAIVIDDFGYNMNNVRAFLDIGQPITFSILPKQQYSNQVARAVRAKGYEAIMHLPLEPKKNGVGEEPDTIRGSMSDQEILSRLKAELDSMPDIDGVSNHMGSKATEDGRVMAVITKELKRRGLFFFDSLTSNMSICRNAAADAEVRYARRDVFLDIPNDPATIENRVKELRKVAFKRGRAIAVGHDRRNTVEILARFMPEMAEEGVVFVYISDLVK